MRTRRSRNAEWMKNASGQLMGLNLGADYCAEHEYGIKQLKQVLGINDESPQGITSRQITLLPEDRTIIIDEVKKKKTGKTLIYVDRSYLISSVKENIKQLPDDLKPWAPKGERAKLTTAWGEEGFGIVASTDEDRQNLRELIKAIEEKQVAVWLGGGGVFQNAGLIIAIVDRVDEDKKQQMLDHDTDAKNLSDAEQKTGIQTLLKNSGKSWYALSPAWSSTIRSTSRGTLETTHEVIYFLNPMEQNKFNHGWFTVEELTQWAQNQGPVMKQPQTA